MEQLIITVNHTHFKGNSYHHGHGERGICPLSMAFEDQMGKRVFVGGETVRENADRYSNKKWNIAPSWQMPAVEAYIARANEGEEFTVDVELTVRK